MSNVLRVVVKDAETPITPDPGDEGEDVTPVTPDPGDEGEDITPVVPDPSDEGEDVTPVVPDTSSDSTDGATSPNTGSFTVAESNHSAGINFATVLPTALFGLITLTLSIILAVKIYRNKKAKSNFKIKTNAKKVLCVTFILSLIFGTASLFTNNFSETHNVKATGETLDITTADTTINITKETEANYALATAEITLNEPTVAGYDLYVYAPNGNELKPELSTQEEAILSVESENSTLASNTYGIAFSDTEIDLADAIWNPIAESEDSPLLIISYPEATATDDKITFYYGVLVDQNLPAGTYTTDIEYKAVPHYYTITFDPNGGALDDTTKDIVAGTALGDLPIPIRTNYIFDGWYTDQTDGEEITATIIPTQATTYYAHWTPTTATFTAGDNIEVVIIADSSDKHKPFYATADSPVVFTRPAAGTKYIITVVPKANYKLSSWSGDTDTLADASLLTTTYTMPDAIKSRHTSLAVTGETGSYTTMQNLPATDCSPTGSNVTDARDGKSYTITKFGSYCYMLSNLRLDNTTDGTTPRVLTDADSNITPNSEGASFTMPTVRWASYQQNYHCKAIMAVDNNEYYYNWYAAKANPSNHSNPTSDNCANTTNDAKSLGSICPAGWILPSYQDYSTTEDFWSNDKSLLIASGSFSSGSQDGIGEYGYLWFSSRYNNYGAYRLYFDGSTSRLVDNTKARGLSVRCLRSL